MGTGVLARSVETTLDMVVAELCAPDGRDARRHTIVQLCRQRSLGINDFSLVAESAFWFQLPREQFEDHDLVRRCTERAFSPESPVVEAQISKLTRVSSPAEFL